MKILKNFFKGLLFLVAFCLVGYYMIKYFNSAVGKAPERATMEKSPHYKDGKFQNMIPTSSAEFGDMPKVIKAYITRKVESAPNKEYVFSESNTGLLENDSLNTIKYNWLGHAAILMEQKGKYILLDPMLGERASPFSFLGPKRYSKPPITSEQLPDLEAVIFSHDHYDHLDYYTIKRIEKKTKKFYVPLGVGASLLYWGVPQEKIVECSWWDQKVQTGDITITATPARHFSGRLFSQNNTFWASWVIEWGDEKVYFGGDTGIFDGFEEIDQKLGPFDMALLPIGAYNEAWHDIHMDPKEAIEAFKQMRAKKVFPIHWGTFDLALHSWYEPIEQLIDMSNQDSIPLITLPQGEWFTKDDHATDQNWWKRYSNEKQGK